MYLVAASRTCSTAAQAEKLVSIISGISHMVLTAQFLFIIVKLPYKWVQYVSWLTAVLSSTKAGVSFMLQCKTVTDIGRTCATCTLLRPYLYTVPIKTEAQQTTQHAYALLGHDRKRSMHDGAVACWCHIVAADEYGMAIAWDVNNASGAPYTTQVLALSIFV